MILSSRNRPLVSTRERSRWPRPASRPFSTAAVACHARTLPAAAPPTPVDAIGRDRARPAIPAGDSIETQVDVAHAGVGARSGRRTAARRGPRCRRPTSGRGRAPQRGRFGPSMPSCRAVRSPRPPDRPPDQPRTALRGRLQGSASSPQVGQGGDRRSQQRSRGPSSAPRCAAAGVSRPVRRPVEPLISRPAAPLRDPRPSPRHPRSVPGPPLARGDP